MQYIIFLVMIATIFALSKMSPGRVMLVVYLPILLLVPDTFHAITPGLPDPSANVAVMIPLFFVAMTAYARYWRVSINDCLVLSLGGLMSYSEFINAGYSEAQNLLLGVLFQMIGPYMVARLAIERENLHVATAKKMVFLLFAVALIGTFEFKFGWNPFLVFGEKLFPGQGFGWVTTFRHGFARVAGPYAHCILAGMMMVLAYRLNRWLEWGGHWEPKFRWFQNLPLSKGRIITLGILAGSIMTIARGPWLGGILAAILVNAARHPKRKQAFLLGILGLLVLAVPGYIGFQAYLDIKPGIEMTMSQETAMYRKVLFEKYFSIAMDHAWLGWGRNTWPKLPGMSSIDNYYLLLSLMHGIVVTGLLVMLMGWMSVRLFLKGMSEPVNANSLAFTFLGIIVAFAVSLVTVYLGEAVVPALFFIFGWAESYIQGPGYRNIGANPIATNHPQKPFQFRRILR